MRFLTIVILSLAAACASGTPIQFHDNLNIGENESRIIGGTAVVDGQLPYQVGLQFKDVWCGGSMISTTLIITAGFCVFKDNISGGTTVGGTAYLGSVNRGAGVSRSFAASDVTIHEKYNPVTLANNLALIKISAVAFSNNIKAVALPVISSSYSTYEGDAVTISGWGVTTDSSDDSSTLIAAKAVITSQAECAHFYGQISANAGTFCISTEAGTATCTGDLGGPAVFNNELVGLASWSFREGCANGPAVFTRVTYFRDWIYNNSGI